MSFDVEPRLIQGPLSDAPGKAWDDVNPFAL